MRIPSLSKSFLTYNLLSSSRNSAKLFSTSLNMSNRGLFIVFEGVDRCGKTTQTNLLTNYLNENGQSAELIRYPDRTTTIGGICDQYLRQAKELNDQAIHLLFSANRWENSDANLSKLNSGTHLICDRYAYSGVAFSASKGLDFNWCKACDTGLPAPDCVIFLEMPIDDSSKRGDFGAERYEKIDFQKKVYEKYLKLKEEDEIDGKIPWHVIDASQTIEQVKDNIKSIVDTLISNDKKPIDKLWVKN